MLWRRHRPVLTGLLLLLVVGALHKITAIAPSANPIVSPSGPEQAMDSKKAPLGTEKKILVKVGAMCNEF